MSHDSSTPGTLLPVGAMPLYDDDLLRALCRWVAEVSDLPVNAVLAVDVPGAGLPAAAPQIRQASSVTPVPAANGCQLAVTLVEGDACPAMVQDEQSSQLQRQETVTCRMLFYGPQAQGVASRFLDGITLAQNNALLRTTTGLVPVTDARQIVPWQAAGEPLQAQHGQQTLLRLQRIVRRSYNLLSLSESRITLISSKE